MSTIVVPAGTVRLLRGWLLQQLNTTAKGIAEGLTEHADIADAIRRLEGARRLLDRVGWTDPADEQDVTLDPSHREALQETLTLALDGERWAAQQGREDARERALTVESFVRSLPPIGDVGMIIPDDLMGVLIDALVDELYDAAAGVAQVIARSVGQARRDPGAYVEPLAALDAVRSLLDALAWGKRATIDLAAYREPLQRALDSRLGVERDMIECSADRATEDDRRQFKNATRYAGQVEELMRVAGVAIPAESSSDA